MSTTLPIKYVKDLETGDRFLPVTSPNAVVWPNGDNLEDKLEDVVPTTRTVNSKALSSNITLTASDVGALPSSTNIPRIIFRRW